MLWTLNRIKLVDGRKRFTVPQAFVGGTTTMIAYRDAVYWCKREDVLKEAGNSRLRMENGRTDSLKSLTEKTG